MNTLSHLVLGGWLLSLSQPSQAATPADLDRLSPFLTHSTVAIAELNLGRLDLPASATALINLLPEPRALWAEPIEQAQRDLAPMLDAFRRAGGDRLYVLLNLAQPGALPPILLIAPPAPSANPERLKSAIAEIIPRWPTQVKHGCAVAGPEAVLPAGPSPSPATIERWRVAFQSAPSGIARLAFLPYPGSDRVLAEFLPTLPRQLGGGPSSIISQGLQWAAASLTLSPEGALAIIVQSETPAAATALRRLLDHSCQTLEQLPEFQVHQATWQAIRPLLLPNVIESRLETRLEFTQLAAVLRGLLPTLEEARAKATQVAVMNQLKQIGLALHMHANDHGDRLPAHLVDSLKYLGDNVRLLLHPDNAPAIPPDFATLSRDAKIAWIDRHSPFSYVRPEAVLKEIKSPMTTVLVHERPKASANSRLGVLFADGHVEVLPAQKLPQILDHSSAPHP